jgi:hypothetical protein
MSPNGTSSPPYDNELGNHVFLPWLRRGISTQTSRVDGLGGPEARAAIDIGVSIGPGPLSTTAPGNVSISLGLYGPGDIRGLDNRVVIRTWPRPNVFEAEPNYFPLIELDPADLPWRYTPARANPADRLRPWLCLIVLRDDEIANRQAPNVQMPVGVVTVKNGTSLPMLDQSWAWAHVQVSGQITVDAASVLDLLENEPHRIIARLLCPRRLEERTVYTGFLVPALERARLASLGMTVPDGVDGLAPAWTPAGTNIQLPVYYEWRFQTGLSGDFESLVRRVQPRSMPPEIGSRPMGVASPGLLLPAAAGTPLNVEAALRALDSKSTDWPDAFRGPWTTALQALLNRPADLLATPNAERVVAPPLYGRWYAAKDRMNATLQPTIWFNDLNADPRTRVSSGTGTQVIQQQQQHFLAGAWAQVTGIRAANAALRHAQLAREAAIRLYQSHVVVRDTARFITFSSAVHPRITTSPQTVTAVLRTSPVSFGVLHPSWRRISRPRGPLGQRLERAGRRTGPSVLERVNTGKLRPAPPPAKPSQITTFAQAGRNLAPSWLTPELMAKLRSILQMSLLQLIVLLLISVILFLVGIPLLALILASGAIALKVFGQNLLSSAFFKNLAIRVAYRSGTLTSEQLLEVPPRPGYVPSESSMPTAVTPAPAGATEHPAATLFRKAAAAAFEEMRAPIAPGAMLQTADLEILRGKISAQINPQLTIEASYRSRFTLATGVVWKWPDPLEQVMPAPIFTDAMYRPLYELSQDWILPGLDKVPADTVSLVETNERFIEAYMVGVNHEMARTLLFNEYPTDQRGTYFRQFWDSSAYLAQSGGTIDPESLKDIKPIHLWPSDGLLGKNSSRVTPSGGDFLVLLLRAELLRRYPNTVVYATRAKWNAQGIREVDDTQESAPVFQGNLGAGVGFWGFTLTVPQVRGGEKTTDDPGWFFILQEPPTEPKSGLEPAVSFGLNPAKWQDLSWADLAADQNSLNAITYIDLNAPLPNTASVIDAKGAVWHADAGTGPTGARGSDLAYITYRVPVRVAVHASQMIPNDLQTPT